MFELPDEEKVVFMVLWFIIFDITNPLPFDHMDMWLEEIQRNFDEDNTMQN